MSTARAQRRFQKRLDAQTDQERNGAPIPADIAARMTPAKEADAAYQVFVDIKGEIGSRPVSPKFIGGDGEEVCFQILEAINSQICLGNLKGWGNARVEKAVHTPIN